MISVQWLKHNLSYTTMETFNDINGYKKTWNLKCINKNEQLVERSKRNDKAIHTITNYYYYYYEEIHSFDYVGLE